MRIDEIIAKIDNEQLAPRVEREVFEYDVQTALKHAQTIGMRLCPSFVIDAENEAVFVALVAWMMGKPFTCKHPVKKTDIEGRIDKGIYLYGGTGAGKSIALDVLAFMTQFQNNRCRFGKTIAPLKWKKVRADEITRKYLETGSVDEWIDERSLLIDDLGNEPSEVMYMGNRIDAVRAVLECRGDKRDCITLITTNLPLGDVTINGEKKNPIRARYGDRVESRLIEMCNYLYLGGKDRRLNI